MLSMSVDYTDLRKATARLKAHKSGREFRKDLTKGLRDGAKPVLPSVRAAALNLPSKGNDTKGLRRKMARVTSIQVKTGGKSPTVRIRIARSRMGDQAALPRVTNEGRWRHQVYGRRNTWVTQTSTRGWFDNANRRGAPIVRRGAKTALDKLERNLSGK